MLIWWQDQMVLRDYITYARDNIQPTLSELAGEHLVHAYVEMRRVGSGKGTISAYPRQLESLIRLSEAHAKMRLSPVVELEDVQEAQRYIRSLREYTKWFILTYDRNTLTSLYVLILF